MAGLPLHIVDVFAERKYEGNQLAVVLEAGALDSGAMQDIAREMHFSETAFVLSGTPQDGAFPVRIFTPAEEVPFAGHPTLGAAWVIRRELLGSRADQVELALAAGRIPVTFGPRGQGPDELWMRQKDPEFGLVLETDAVAAVLGLSPDDLDGRYPIQAVSTGLPFLIVPLKTLEAACRARTDPARLAALAAGQEAKSILVFSPETLDPGRDLHVRVFVDLLGIPEDPATGSGNGCLAAYLVRHGYFGRDRIDIRVEQGLEIGRPSVLLLRAARRGEAIEVEVGGGVIPVARGELL